mgnify:CR=1 FL=1
MTSERKIVPDNGLAADLHTAPQIHREDSVQDAIIEEQYARLVETVRDYNPAADFVHIESAYHFAKRCHEGGIHVMLESCGHANYEMFAPALPYIDAMYFDVKHIDPEIHRQLTGADNRLILENLHKIAAFGVPIIVRTPVIPGYNDSDENIMGIAEMLRSIGRVESYELLAYHKLGESKYHALGRTYPVAEGTEPPSLERMRELVAKANSVLAGSGKTCFYVE